LALLPARAAVAAADAASAGAGPLLLVGPEGARRSRDAAILPYGRPSPRVIP
jgi:hypothetical protein